MAIYLQQHWISNQTQDDEDLWVSKCISVKADYSAGEIRVKISAL